MHHLCTKDEDKNFNVLPGLWKHFKGNVYEVIAEALDVTEERNVVIYRRGDSYYTRAKSEWFSLVDDGTNSGFTYRFVKINNE